MSENTKLKVLLIGCGFWGKNVLRNLLKFDNISLAVVESDTSKWKAIPSNILRYHDLDWILDHAKVDCAVICTPIASHPELIAKLLLKDIKILCQKPAFRTREEYHRVLSDETDDEKDQSYLMACHTFCYHPAIEHIQCNLSNLGKMRYYKSTRINLGLFNRDNTVLDDLFVHDASILCYLFPNEVIEYISATGTDNIKKGLIDTANVTIKYKSGFLANVDVSWVSAVKNRQIILVGSDKTVVYDDCQTEGKVKYYDSGIDYDDNLLFSYRKGNMWSPKLDEKEAIENELRHFFECLHKKCEPRTGLKHINVVTRMLEAANKSVLEDGKPIYNIFE